MILNHQFREMNREDQGVYAILLLLSAAISFASVGCGRAPTSTLNSNPVPAVVSLSPDTATTLGTAFTLTVNGSGFVPASVVQWNGSNRMTTFVNSSQLMAQIGSSDMAAAGKVAVTVFNPAPGGGISSPLVFTIRELAPNPPPTAGNLFPSMLTVQGPAFTLTVNGSNFVPASVVLWNGSSRATAFVNSSQLTAQIGASDVASAGQDAVTVSNPAPGGGTSNSLSFTVLPVPRFAYFTAPSGAIFAAEVDAATGQLRYAGYGFDAAAGTPQPVFLTLDPTGQFLYAVNTPAGNNPGSISMFKVNVNNGVLTSIAAPVAAGNGPTAVAVHPSSKFVYATNFLSNNISMYGIVADGSLAPIGGGTVSAGIGPQSIVMDPAGKFAYVANSGSGDVSMYAIDSTGTLRPNTVGGGSGTISVGGTPRTVAVEPSGRFAYVAVDGSIANVLTFNISSTGTLTQVGNAVSSGTNPHALAVDPLGRFLYVANSTDISMFSIDSGSGALKSLGANVTAASGQEPVAIAVDPSDEFVYVGSISEGGGTISRYAINQSTGVLTLTATIRAVAPLSLVLSHGNTPVTHTPKFAYVTNQDNTVSMFSIDPGSGALTQITNAVETGAAPRHVAVDPMGKFAYVTNASDNTVSMYTIGSDGALTLANTPGGGNTISSGKAPNGVAVDATGRFVYVADEGSSAISVYTIDPRTGLLTAQGITIPIPNSGLSSLAVDPSGQFVYAANNLSSTIATYSIDPGLGILTHLGTDATTGARPVAVAVDPTASFVYSANQFSNDVSMFTTPVPLTPIANAIAAGTNPFAIAIDPSGRFVYVVNVNGSTVSMYSIDPLSGKLIPNTNAASIATGAGPVAVAAEPSGKFVYVIDQFAPGISIYAINPDGTLTPAGNVAVGNAPNGIAIVGGTQ